MGDGDRFNRFPPLPVNPDQVGQVVLALGVLRRNRPDGVKKAVEFEGINPGVNLSNITFGRGGVLVLHDACNLLAGPHDAAVAVRPINAGCHDRHRRVRASMRIDEVFQRVRGQQRHVARQQNDRPCSRSE